MKPFDIPFTPVHNYILDNIMPDLSPNAWKVLCVALRQTFGWADDTTESGRKLEDEISYSQFMSKTGIGSKATLSKAIKECLSKWYLLRRVTGEHQGTKRPTYAYRLNRNYEVAAGTETVLAAGTETVLAAGTETVLAAGTETVLTKQRKKERKSGGVVQEHVYTLLIDFGVSDSVSQKLAVESSEEQVSDWIAYIKKATNLHNPVAFLVSKLQAGENVPQIHHVDSREERYRRYAGGKYAHLIKH